LRDRNAPLEQRPARPISPNGMRDLIACARRRPAEFILQDPVGSANPERHRGLLPNCARPAPSTLTKRGGLIVREKFAAKLHVLNTSMNGCTISRPSFTLAASLVEVHGGILMSSCLSPRARSITSSASLAGHCASLRSSAALVVLVYRGMNRLAARATGSNHAHLSLARKNSASSASCRRRGLTRVRNTLTGDQIRRQPPRRRPRPRPRMRTPPSSLPN